VDDLFARQVRSPVTWLVGCLLAYATFDRRARHPRGLPVQYAERDQAYAAALAAYPPTFSPADAGVDAKFWMTPAVAEPAEATASEPKISTVGQAATTEDTPHPASVAAVADVCCTAGHPEHVHVDALACALSAGTGTEQRPIRPGRRAVVALCKYGVAG